MKKKAYSILMLSWEYPPHITGGLAVAVAGMVRALASRGHHIMVLVPELFGDEEETENVKLFDVKGQFFRLSKAEQAELSMRLADQIHHPQIMVYQSATYGAFKTNLEFPIQICAERAIENFNIRGGYGPAIMQDLGLFARFAELLASRLHFDIVHAHDWVTYPAGQAIARATGSPLVCHIHATEFDRSGENINQAVYDLEREGLQAAALVIAVSHFTAAIVSDRYGIAQDKIRVVHNALVDDSKPEQMQSSSSIELPLSIEKKSGEKIPDFKHVQTKIQEYIAELKNPSVPPQNLPAALIKNFFSILDKIWRKMLWPTN